ncbi:hypothetical protein IKD67_01855 [Candidatus Saccharibacteria bacterium]|nr:hypothetical protein [Candidatus Saccharibacteria bacterium]
MVRKAEEQLQIAVAGYLVENYPNVLFRTDAGGIKLPISLAKKLKDMNGGRRGWPDMFIAKPWVSIENQINGTLCAGLFLELKKEGTRIFKKDGTLVADEHIREQFDVLEQLRQQGYEAEFACGFEEAKALIDSYLGK